MFELKCTFTFEAGHQLTYHEGRCKRPHGHSYTLIVVIQGKQLQKSGPAKNMVIDFDEINQITKKLIASHLDHHWLNDTLETDSPSAEFIAQWIYHRLKKDLPNLHAVTLHETARSSVTYSDH